MLPKFLDFIGDRVLVAHNSDFDTGFIRAECQRLGYDYHYTAADTLILSQNLLPQLNKFKLNIVSNALSLPDFNHHRAADDAMTCGSSWRSSWSSWKRSMTFTICRQSTPP